MEDMTFGTWLKLRRKALDLTREQLAQQVGYSAATIRKIEAEERRPSEELIQRLAEILNLPPAELDAFRKFAHGSWRAVPDEPSAASPWQTAKATPRTNLPTTVTSLIGRELDITAVLEYLGNEETRLVTLIGPLGVGKTRLSLQVARQALAEFPDGAFFVPLAPLEDPALVAPAAIRALGYVETRQCPAIDQLIEGIADKKLLLVLDNCEHLVEDVAPLVAALLLACPNLKLLTTSREALRVPGEWLYTVPALKTPPGDTPVELAAIAQYPALTLFSERARAVRADFHLDDSNLPTVAAICSRLDGLPLAIELISARMRLMSPQSLLERLSDQFILSADGMRAVSARQKTLRNAINWSYTLLSPEEQQLFAGLAIFSGSFSLPTAEAIFAARFANRPAVDLLTSLIDKSLVQRTLDPTGEPRFHLLFTIKQFALQRLRELDIEAALRDAHLAHFLALAEQADRGFHGHNQLAWIDRVEAEHDEIRAALEWCVSSHNAEAGLRLLGALGWPWEVRSHYREMRNMYEMICNLPTAADYPAYYARLLNHLGRYSWVMGDLPDSRALLEKSQGLLAALGTQGEQELAEGLNWLGMVALTEDQGSEAAEACFSRSYQLFQKWADPRIAISIFHLGILEIERGNATLAIERLEESQHLFRQMGDLFFTARVTVFLGQLTWKQGDLEKAAEYYEACLALDRRIRFWNEITSDLRELGDIYRSLGRYDQAEQYYTESLTTCREHGLGPCRQWFSLGLLALQQGNSSLARQYFTQPGDPEQIQSITGAAGMMLAGLAAVAAVTGQVEWAARLYGAAQASLEEDNYHLAPYDQQMIVRYIQDMREQLDAAVFDALVKEGRATSLERTLTYALESGAQATAKPSE